MPTPTLIPSTPSDIISIQPMQTDTELTSSTSSTNQLPSAENTNQNPNVIVPIRSFVVSFISDQVRDTVLRLHRVSDKYTFNDIVDDSNNTCLNRIYINKMLPTALHALLVRARKLTKDRGYNKPWITNNKIAIKKSSNSTVEYFSNMSELNKLQ